MDKYWLVLSMEIGLYHIRNVKIVTAAPTVLEILCNPAMDYLLFRLKIVCASHATLRLPCVSIRYDIPYIVESNPHPNLIRTSFCRFIKRIAIQL
jgi:hypothetical protein